MLGGVLAAILTFVCGQPLDAAGATRTRTQKKVTTGAASTARKAPARVTRTAAAKKATATRATASSKTRTTSAARRRAISRSRAAARAREARDLATPRFKVDETGREVPAPRAAAAIIYDPETNEVLFEEHALEQRSIASITKVMTALVSLEAMTDPSAVVKVERADVTRASTTYLRAGYTVTVDELLHLLLIGSDNAAARVLARVSPYGSDGFVARMNEKARELGLSQTHYEDPSGLLSGNVSTAYEMARLISYAVADERVGSVMRKAEFNFVPGKRNVHVNSTNRFVRSGEIEVIGGKTGFISSSGYCLATLVRLPQTGRQVAMVVLGARSNAARFAETRHLFNWLNGSTLAAAGPDGGQQ
ncbi:MAG: D-alanyl-D-alanine carboxypeptidase [Acidobacteria bacterium]|nr:D-alanyl-D-alanine carboxypeptidase [Acidobacteriota bacterium]